MKELKTYVQEPYEAPAILDVTMFTAPVVHGDSGPTSGEEPDEDDVG
jgi:hypothetical protein